MSDIVLVQQIRHVRGGYIVEARWPFGGRPAGYGEVICKTLREVFDLIENADIDPDTGEEVEP